VPLGEPHYTVLMHRGCFESIETYPVGTNIYTMQKSPDFTDIGNERVVSRGNTVIVYATINNGVVKPENISANQGQDVVIHVTNHGQSKLDHYVYEVISYDQMYRWRPGETATLAFKAEKSGVFPLVIDNYHSPEGAKLQGYLTVKYNDEANNDRLLAYSRRVQEDMQMQAFIPSQLEMKSLLDGELEFMNYGCNACHRFGDEFNGPDLLLVDKRRDDKWLRSWIMNPQKHMQEPDIAHMRQKYKLAMPNQNVSEEDVEKIILYMRLKTAQFMAEM
jgi:hypothetical protein